MIDQSRLKKIKLVVFDLDGTLLNKYAQIGEETIELVRELKSMGVRFSFASGRLHNALVDYASTLGLESPLISLDGTIIKSHPDKKIIYESYIKDAYVKKAINMANDNFLKIALCHDEAVYYTPKDAMMLELLGKYESRFEEIESYDDAHITKTLEFIVAGDLKEPVKAIEEKMQFPSSFGLRTSFYKSQSEEGIYFLEVRNKKCSKGLGLARLNKHLKIKIKETAVMGDWYNDRSMFETKALKIAVANAVEKIKGMADYVTERTNDEDAAAEFLAMLLKAKKA
ncbi:MAG: Cof-type HAD-IIB family hydrolase [Ignavibacteriae bacterium]|nr:Cof-type HAD-IIB family hydrolase [Ignavibacteriota bacterium]